MFASRRLVGVMGLGDNPGPVQQDITAYYQAGLIVGAGGTSPLDMSNSTADEQAAFTSGFNAGSAPVTVQQLNPSTSAAGTGSAPPTTPVISNTIVLGVAGIAALFFILAAVKR